MRAKGELDDIEFTKRKRTITDEIIALEEKLALEDSSDAVLADRSSILDVLVKAKSRFQKGDIDLKRKLLFTIGLNLSLKNKTLDIAMALPFKSLRNITPLVKKHFDRIEPGKPHKLEEVMDKSITSNPKWWAVQDLNL